MKLSETLTFDEAKIVVESANEGKDLYMKGICIQGGVRNANQRVYPVEEIGRAVKTLNDQCAGGYSVLGEVDHPEGLNINLDRVSHMITEMWMDGSNGYGKLKILPTPWDNELEQCLKAELNQRPPVPVTLVKAKRRTFESKPVGCSGTSNRISQFPHEQPECKVD